jgi:hypothetical protein
MAGHQLENLRDTDVVLDSLPDEVAASIEVRDAWARRLPPAAGGLEFLVADLQRWTPGMRLRVAFLGGSSQLHREIADATGEIAVVANLDLDFGFNQATGQFRTWSEQDTDYAAEIRVSFDRAGFFSLVGTDSTDDSIGHPSQDVGGHPHQRSLNLGGFDVRKPPKWQGTVRHEFLHALAFHHAHQNMRGPCEEEFRWDDDEGYTPTKDADGRFVPDGAGRRPGIYTYLAGFPNFWNKAKVDHNLRRSEGDDVVGGPFDRQSVMLYRFEPFFYRTSPSQCAPTGDGLSLSEGDARGLRLLYPDMGPDLDAIVAHTEAMLETVTTGGQPPAGREEVPAAAGGPFAERATRVLAERLSALT